MTYLKVIVAGGRDFNDYKLFTEVMYYHMKLIEPKKIEIVTGMARGADLMAYNFAKKYGIRYKEFPARWYEDSFFNKRAGFDRNVSMAQYADELIAFHDGHSRGTAHMIKTMREVFKKPTYVIKY